MRIFNAFQIVALFVALPFLVSWESRAAFPGHEVAMYATCAFYLVVFGVMVASVYSFLSDWD